MSFLRVELCTDRTGPAPRPCFLLRENPVVDSFVDPTARAGLRSFSSPRPRRAGGGPPCPRGLLHKYVVNPQVPATQEDGGVACPEKVKDPLRHARPAPCGKRDRGVARLRTGPRRTSHTSGPTHTETGKENHYRILPVRGVLRERRVSVSSTL